MDDMAAKEGIGRRVIALNSIDEWDESDVRTSTFRTTETYCDVSGDIQLEELVIYVEARADKAVTADQRNHRRIRSENIFKSGSVTGYHSVKATSCLNY